MKINIWKPKPKQRTSGNQNKDKKHLEQTLVMIGNSTVKKDFIFKKGIYLLNQ